MMKMTMLVQVTSRSRHNDAKNEIGQEFEEDKSQKKSIQKK